MMTGEIKRAIGGDDDFYVGMQRRAKEADEQRRLDREAFISRCWNDPLPADALLRECEQTFRNLGERSALEEVRLAEVAVAIISLRTLQAKG